MTDYMYRVVSRSPGGEWEPVETGKRIYFTLGTARSTRTMKQQEHEYQETARERLRERHPELTNAYAPDPREFAVARIPVGEWEVLTDD